MYSGSNSPSIRSLRFLRPLPFVPHSVFSPQALGSRALKKFNCRNESNADFHSLKFGMGACASKNSHGVAESSSKSTTSVLLPQTPQPTTANKTTDEGSTTAPGEPLRSGSEDVWNDEDEEAHPPPTQLAVAQKRRRRLSVSTVDSKGPTAAMQSGELVGDLVDAQGVKTTRTKITKFNDPALELVDRSKGAVREVTLRMLKDLFPEAEHYAVFGSPSYDMQRGFDVSVWGVWVCKRRCARLVVH
eukprot:Blabericola_migrator_1__8951@NODE_474_length_8206_cov_62_991277_g69_i1_p5_GENE_NODE_474_length_8206_cov_62_991277_g69_i1NODE_474_length_8206_cov_62_991277_g69_i1_p5_ORF_typecomplete_len245_score36_26_NODE_474_length_8206_cov_62_991277_g69_i167287462